MTTATLGLQDLALSQLHESPLNPRKTFAQGPLEELAASIQAKGVLTPLLVRPNAAGFEIGAGHRRYRAAQLAGLTTVPAIVRAMTDQEFLELLVFENDEREDLHPLEEAQGYKTLMTKGGYTVERIAERRGCSVKYIYDRVKLLSLTEAAKQDFLAGKFTAGHAILLARLSPKDQARAMLMDHYHPGLYEAQQDGLFDKTADRTKPRSVREFQSWIDDHVRFDKTAVDPMLFPETARALAASTEKAEKIVQVTPAHYLPPEARDPKERIYFGASWKRADGHRKSKPCAHAVTGVIVAGEGRGDAFKVCTAKEKCKVHWAAAQRERAARRAEGRTGTTKREDPAAAKAKAEKRRAEEERGWALARETDKRFLTVLLGKMKGGLSRDAWLLIASDALDSAYDGIRSLLEESFGLDRVTKMESFKTEELPRLVLGLRIAELLDDGYAPALKPVFAFAKTLKVDRVAIAKEVQAQHKAEQADDAKGAQTTAKKTKQATKKATTK